MARPLRPVFAIALLWGCAARNAASASLAPTVASAPPSVATSTVAPAQAPSRAVSGWRCEPNGTALRVVSVPPPVVLGRSFDTDVGSGGALAASESADGHGLQVDVVWRERNAIESHSARATWAATEAMDDPRWTVMDLVATGGHALRCESGRTRCQLVSLTARDVTIVADLPGAPRWIVHDEGPYTVLLVPSQDSAELVVIDTGAPPSSRRVAIGADDGVFTFAGRSGIAHIDGGRVALESLPGTFDVTREGCSAEAHGDIAMPLHATWRSGLAETSMEGTEHLAIQSGRTCVRALEGRASALAGDASMEVTATSNGLTGSRRDSETVAPVRCVWR